MELVVCRGSPAKGVLVADVCASPLADPVQRTRPPEGPWCPVQVKSLWEASELGGVREARSHGGTVGSVGRHAQAAGPLCLACSPAASARGSGPQQASGVPLSEEGPYLPAGPDVAELLAREEDRAGFAWSHQPPLRGCGRNFYLLWAPPAPYPVNPLWGSQHWAKWGSLAALPRTPLPAVLEVQRDTASEPSTTISHLNREDSYCPHGWAWPLLSTPQTRRPGTPWGSSSHLPPHALGPAPQPGPFPQGLLMHSSFGAVAGLPWYPVSLPLLVSGNS